MSREALLLHLHGLTPYGEAWELQRRVLAARQQGRIADTLILLEHPPVFTVGRSGARDHLLFPREVLSRNGFEVFDIERGGSVTYHGPGQLVAYPIIDLRALGEDVVRFMRLLEESIIRTLRVFGIEGQRIRGMPGVWVGDAKIAAVGIAVKRHVTMHGMALNVAPTLDHFAWINPCGLGRPVTSMAAVLGHTVPLADVAAAYASACADVHGLAFQAISPAALDALLPARGGLGPEPAPALSAVS